MGDAPVGTATLRTVERYAAPTVSLHTDESGVPSGSVKVIVVEKTTRTVVKGMGVTEGETVTLAVTDTVSVFVALVVTDGVLDADAVSDGVRDVDRPTSRAS